MFIIWFDLGQSLLFSSRITLLSKSNQMHCGHIGLNALGTNWAPQPQHVEVGVWVDLWPRTRAQGPRPNSFPLLVRCSNHPNLFCLSLDYASFYLLWIYLFGLKLTTWYNKYFWSSITFFLKLILYILQSKWKHH